MRILSSFIFALLFTLPAFAADNVTGHWLTENERAVVHIDRCEAGLCGQIYWIIDGGLMRDKHNPDPARRDDPICGMNILWGFTQDAPGNWSGGHIYKADDGDTYNAKLQLKSPEKLSLRGYVGIPLFGKTQTWTRVNAANYEACTSS